MFKLRVTVSLVLLLNRDNFPNCWQQLMHQCVLTTCKAMGAPVYAHTCTFYEPSQGHLWSAIIAFYMMLVN